MGVWNDYANKRLMDSYSYSLNINPVIINKETREISWGTLELDNSISGKIKTLCLTELAKELEYEGFEVKSAGKWVLHISKDEWEITLDLDGNLPYSDALLKNITNNYKHWKEERYDK